MVVSGTQWTIRYEDQVAIVVEVGGGLRGYSTRGDDIVDGYAEDELCPGAAGQILAPWPNRLRDGRYRFDGEAHQLALSEPSHHNAIHGLVRWVPWHPVTVTEGALTLEYILHPQPGYPWLLQLLTSYSLEPDGLRVAHSARNLGDRPAPFGLGAHPYLRIPGVPMNELALCVRARTRLLVDGRLLPIGAAKVSGGELDYGLPRRIGATELNVTFGGLERDDDGRSTVELSAANGRAVRVWADAEFKWWQLYTGESLAPQRRRRAMAVEPMTCPPDALRSGRDLITLQPGETWHGEWGINGVR